MSPTHGGTAPGSQRMVLPMLIWGLLLAYIAVMRMTFDLALTGRLDGHQWRFGWQS